eukprot:TRINITY_DN587_c0_g4_i1.p1 TRINITY_DN587_c0_g4~~TRINITY_DN587_c0_g4_i1.p1  ORF type:complete len:441 (+),score=210.74 TRINITY_DN587_c0_g4_i1:95-1417(+)
MRHNATNPYYPSNSGYGYPPPTAKTGKLVQTAPHSNPVAPMIPQITSSFPMGAMTSIEPLGTNMRKLYVGNLSCSVEDGLLEEIFRSIGTVENCRIVRDKNGQSSGYGFVAYYDNITAEKAIFQLNNRKIYDQEIKVNWAHATMQREDTSTHQHIFVGDLAPEVDDKILLQSFTKFGSCSDARVIVDGATGRSRGYGFVSFRKREDAERAIYEMNGEKLLNRPMRCNWANQKSLADGYNGTDYTNLLNSTSDSNLTVYVGNLAPEVSETTLRTVFGDYGEIEDVRIQRDKNYGFVRFKAHEQAALSIFHMNGKLIGSKAVKCGWGKDRSALVGSTTSTSTTNGSPSAPVLGPAPPPSTISSNTSTSSTPPTQISTPTGAGGMAGQGNDYNTTMQMAQYYAMMSQYGSTGTNNGSYPYYMQQYQTGYMPYSFDGYQSPYHQ